VPGETCEALDRLVASRGFENRSQAVTTIINESVLAHCADNGNDVMAGSITVFYDQNKNNLLATLAALKRRCIDEVIGSLQVLLEDDQMMEVILVQGPVKTLRRITDEMVACKGVKAGKLTLTSSIIPQLHPLRKPQDV
jgi:CopG family nickel-responsive transcriptional regulator